MTEEKQPAARRRFPWWFWTTASMMVLLFVGVLLWPVILQMVKDRVEIEIDTSTWDWRYEASEDAPEGLLNKGIALILDPDSLTGDLVVSLDAIIRNRNPIDLEITSLHYVIIANKKTMAVGEGLIDEGGLTLAARDEVTIRLENRISVSSILEGLDLTLNALMIALQGNLLKVSVEIKVHVRTWLGEFDHAYSVNGLEAMSNIKKFPAIQSGGKE